MTNFTGGKSPSIPLHAAYIWAEGDNLYLACEGTAVKLPPRGQFIKGASKIEAVLFSILRQREATDERRIGHLEHITKAQVKGLPKEIADRWLAEDRRAKVQAKAEAEAKAKAEAEAKAMAFLEDLGL